MNIQLENLLKSICGIPQENPSILDGTVMTQQEAEGVLARWGLEFSDLQFVEDVPIRSYLRYPDSYDIGLRNIKVHQVAGNRVLCAELGVQFKKAAYHPTMNFLGALFQDAGLLEIPSTTREIPRYFLATALIDKPASVTSE